MSLILAALLLSTDPVSTPPPQQQQEVQKPTKEKKICKKQAADTGSHMSKSLCLTQREWDTRSQGLSSDEYGAVHGSVGH